MDQASMNTCDNLLIPCNIMFTYYIYMRTNK